MPVHDPTTLLVECDRCAHPHHIETTTYPGDGCTHSPLFGIEESTLNEHGWTMDGEETFCKECSKDRQNEEEK